MSDYHRFLAKKCLVDPPTGISYRVSVPEAMKPHQADIARWALRRGRAAVFAGTGLGKTLIELVWARQVAEHTGKPVLILAPLAVAHQHVREGAHFGLVAILAKRQSDVGSASVFVTNYGKMDHFDMASFGGVALDESSIIKSHDGKTRERLIRECQGVPFRLAATATPAPNDFMELGNHAEFLGVMSYAEMLAMFFIHDGGETQKWRLKGHAQSDFWKWMASWSVMLRKPSDLGYPNDGYDLPPLFTQQHTAAVEYRADLDTGTLFPIEARTMQERIGARRSSIDERVALAAEIVATKADVPWVLWCQLNDESAALAKAIPGAVEVRGSDDEDDKERKLIAFSEGRIRVLVSKPSLTGFGLNWQHCADTIFVGLNDSFEQVYQATRRFWRFGQTKPVTAHFIASELEGAVVANLRRKEADAERMAVEMVNHIADLSAAELHGMERTKAGYEPRQVQPPTWLPASLKAVDEAHGPDWSLYMGDAVEALAGLPEASVGYSVFSPPFSSLYTYSNSDRDMGNCSGDDEFFAHFDFLLSELYRVLLPGRSVSMHCMDLPTSKVRDGIIGLRDFPGELIRAGERMGFVYHSSVVIWKDPVTSMQRTKAFGLLHKTIRNDSSMSRMGIPDRVVTLRKPGENPVPISHDEDYPVDRWQRIASPIWDDINPSETLQFRAAREGNDERHIAPLQLEVIRRCVELWSAPKDIVLTPFAGIGSELYVAVDMGRRAMGIELKPTYFQQAVSNLRYGDSIRGGSLFAKA